MRSISYDGTFEGLLTAVFEMYEYKYTDVTIYREDRLVHSLFSPTHHVETNHEKADRIINGLKKYLPDLSIQNLYIAFLSEDDNIANMILQYIQYVFAAETNIDHDFSNDAVLGIAQTVTRVRREKHRMEAFVRFQLTGEQLFYAMIEPDFNVLPLIRDHFENRYADQRWLIYDGKRKYGLHYDLQNCTEVTLDFAPDIPSAAEPVSIYDEREPLFQQLWQHYFDSVNIASRKNLKLHLRHMPKRYWKFLPEKKPAKMRRVG